jgi:2-polyprenyl-3-methyl-5-hydroxy-6-metoxy-1,4-benzoquinol methylase
MASGLRPVKQLASISERLNDARNIHGITAISRSQISAYTERAASLTLKPQSRALSVSCGDGMFDYVTFMSNDKINSICAVDIVDCPVNPRDVIILKEKGRWDYVRVAAESPLPFETGVFDLVFHHDVIEHVRKPQFFLQEQLRVLKKGGYIIMGTPNLLRPVNMLKIITGRLHFPLVIGENKQIGEYIHLQEFTKWSVVRMLEEAGFVDVQVDYCYFGLHFLNIKFADFPEGNIGQTLCHYLMFTAKKG